MTHKYTSHSSSLFLIELILAILFFSIASAVCVQLFVKSHSLSKKAELLAISVNECSDAAEIIRSADSFTEIEKRLKEAYPDALSTENGLHIPYENGCQMNLYWEHPSGKILTEISYIQISTSETIYELKIEHLLTGERP